MNGAAAHRYLRRQSLRGVDLRAADLRGADLRGLDLSGADLRQADLRDARTGLGAGAVVAQTVVAAAVAAAGGFTSSWLGQTIRHALQSPDPVRQIAGVLLASEFVLCLIAMVWRGTWFAMQRVLPPTTVLLLGAIVGMVVLHGSVSGSGWALLALVVLFTVMVLAVVLSRAIAAGVSRLALAVVLVAWLLGARGASGNVATVVVAIATVIAGMRAATGSVTSPRLSRWARRLGTLGGTSLRGADLSDAKVSAARFRSSDLRGARIDRVDWDAAREVDFCHFDDEATAPPRKKLPLRVAWTKPRSVAHDRHP